MKPEHERKIRRVTDETVAEFIKRLPDLIQKRLHQGVLALIGFEGDPFSWSNLRVKTNETRANLVFSHISAEVNAAIQRDVSQIILGELPRWMTDPAAKRAILAEYRRVYECRFAEALKEAAKKKADADALLLLAELELESRPLVRNDDIQDPISFEGQTGAAILQRMVETSLGPLLTEGGDGSANSV